jgi:hypothetical protein
MPPLRCHHGDRGDIYRKRHWAGFYDFHSNGVALLGSLSAGWKLLRVCGSGARQAEIEIRE